MRGGNRTRYLRYRVPDHQDSTVLLAALGKEGYDAAPLYEHAHTTLTVPFTGPEAEERERIRGILAGVHESTLGGPDIIYGPVRFEDEAGEGARAVPPGERAKFALAATPVRTVAAPSPSVSTGRVPLVRAAWGTLLLAATDPLRRATGLPPSSESELVLRARGVHHLAWAGATAAAQTRRTMWVGVALDSALAVTAVAYAASQPERRRAGLASAGVSTAFAADGLRRLRRTR